MHLNLRFPHPQEEEEQSIVAEDEGVVQMPLEGYKYVILHLGCFTSNMYTTGNLLNLLNCCIKMVLNCYLVSLFTEEYPSSTSQMKCPKGLLEILGMPTAKTFEKDLKALW